MNNTPKTQNLTVSIGILDIYHSKLTQSKMDNMDKNENLLKNKRKIEITIDNKNSNIDDKSNINLR
jgi:hypothetical protein